jgi:hypothetical protein
MKQNSYNLPSNSTLSLFQRIPEISTHKHNENPKTYFKSFRIRTFIKVKFKYSVNYFVFLFIRSGRLRSLTVVQALFLFDIRKA